MNYSSYLTQIATMAVVPEDDPNFLIVLPQASENANLRICRALDFLQTSTSMTAALAAGTRRITVPLANIIVSEQVNVLTPAGSTDPETSERLPLTPTTKEVLDVVYGNASYRGVPEYYAMFDQNVFLVGPFSDGDYTVEIVGTQRPAPLSASNPTTFISEQLPDLLIYATMSYISAYQRNWGAASGDPAQGINYEMMFNTLLQDANTEENRKKYAASAWSSEGASPVATPTR